MTEFWKNNPYYPVSSQYQSIFGEKVYKVPVTTVDDCPNRQGLKGMETCVFCDVWGSAAKAESLDLELQEQIIKYKAHIGQRFGAKKFLVYFQAYTNSFEKVSTLRTQFETAYDFKDVVGLVIGTRPDCLSPKVLELWEEFHQRRHVFVELGVQSFSNRDLEFLKRGHTAEQSIKAVHRIHKNTNVDIGIHLMFGNPGETDQEIIESAKICSGLPITNVKIHNLHVLKNTPLEKTYFEKKFTPIELGQYAHRVQIFLEQLRPDISVHRLAAFASRWDELVAPKWTKDKMKTHQFIVDFMKSNKSQQGLLYTEQT